ncbi:RbsD or FucU transport [Gryllotalpicola ginsengisoli]|uniref:RbsD or FucU transport n=1 Tax=Gryllotalpicola ginsengisoli TaxID=444608 RepID=UPI0003B36058|nr:RbsD or FucU transport [Gryllotalpicola ginsengisoli]
MLKNLDPLLTGTLLTALDEMEPGQWLTLTAGEIDVSDASRPCPVIDLSGVSTEAAASAILSVLPLDRSGAPIVYLDDVADGEELPDVVFAICGIAADAELRRVPMSRLEETDFRLLAGQSTVSVRSHCAGAPSAFLLRKGASAID